jgi:imidazolonepropionase-like amidohydrolase
MKQAAFPPFGWYLLSGLLALGIATAHAATPAELIKGYVTAAGKTGAGFSASAVRGQAFFNQTFTASTDLPSCSTCHTVNPAAEGKHAITGKHIDPLAPAANAERFTDSEKTEKWFKRNCNDVIGRLCTAAEKADFITYLVGVKK